LQNLNICCCKCFVTWDMFYNYYFFGLTAFGGVWTNSLLSYCIWCFVAASRGKAWPIKVELLHAVDAVCGTVVIVTVTPSLNVDNVDCYWLVIFVSICHLCLRLCSIDWSKRELLEEKAVCAQKITSFCVNMVE
jgi:hypothetical protein